jgi:hypothetical protein
MCLPPKRIKPLSWIERVRLALNNPNTSIEDLTTLYYENEHHFPSQNSSHLKHKNGGKAVK